VCQQPNFKGGFLIPIITSDEIRAKTLKSVQNRAKAMNIRQEMSAKALYFGIYFKKGLTIV